MKPLLLKIHVNPPAEVSTSMKVYQGHTLEKTYMGEDFFWAITPTAGDYILFKFDKPVNVERSVTVEFCFVLESRPSAWNMLRCVCLVHSRLKRGAELQKFWL